MLCTSPASTNDERYAVLVHIMFLTIFEERPTIMETPGMEITSASSVLICNTPVTL